MIEALSEFQARCASPLVAGLLLVLARMWHTILTKPPRAGWMYLPFVLAVCAVFWVLNLDRFLTG